MNQPEKMYISENSRQNENLCSSLEWSAYFSVDIFDVACFLSSYKSSSILISI